MQRWIFGTVFKLWRKSLLFLRSAVAEAHSDCVYRQVSLNTVGLIPPIILAWQLL